MLTRALLALVLLILGLYEYEHEHHHRPKRTFRQPVGMTVRSEKDA